MKQYLFMRVCFLVLVGMFCVQTLFAQTCTFPPSNPKLETGVVQNSFNFERCGDGIIAKNFYPLDAAAEEVYRIYEYNEATLTYTLLRTENQHVISFTGTAPAIQKYGISKYSKLYVCESAILPVVVNFYALPSLPVVTNLSFCGARTNLKLSVDNATDNYYNWTYANGSGLYQGFGSPTLASYSFSQTLTVYVSHFKLTSPYCESAKVPLTITINPVPAVPVIAGSPNFVNGIYQRCGDGEIALEVFAALPGESFRWYEYDNVTQTSVLIPNETSKTYKPVSVVSSSPKLFQVARVNSAGCESAKINMECYWRLLPPQPATIFKSSSCNGVEMASYNNYNYIVNWYKPDGITLLDQGSGIITIDPVTGRPSGTLISHTVNNTLPTNYYVSYTGLFGCESVRKPFLTEANASLNPVAPTVERCGPGSVTLTVVNEPAHSYKWYTQATGGVPLTTGVNATNYSLTTNVVGTTTYYVSAVRQFSYNDRLNSNPSVPQYCEGLRYPVVVTVNPLPVVTISPAFACQGQATTLTVSGTNTYKWMNVTSQVLSLLPTLDVTISAATSYTIEATDAKGCKSTSTHLVSITTVAIPTSADVITCFSTSAMLTAQGALSGDLYVWYDAATGGSLLKTSNDYLDNTYVTPVLTAGKTYYVAIRRATCESQQRKPVIVGIQTLATPTASNVNRCGIGSVVLTATGSTGIYQWYDAAVGGNVIGNGSPLTHVVSAAQTVYVAAVQTTPSTCYSQRIPVSISINGFTAVPTVKPFNRCGAGAVTLQATGAPVGAKYKWYDGATLTKTSTDELDNTWVTNVSTSKTFYVSLLDASGCEGPKVVLNVTVNKIPQIAVSANPQVVCPGSPTTLTATVIPGSYYWYNLPNTSTIVARGNKYVVIPVKTTTYQVKVIDPKGCIATAQAKVAVSQVLAPQITFESTDVCYKEALRTDIKNTLNYTYTVSLPSDAGVFQTQKTNELLTTWYHEMLQSTTVRVTALNSVTGCSRTFAYPVTVTPLPNVPLAIDGSRCESGKVTIGASGAAQGESYNWYTTPTATSTIATGISYTTQALNDTRNYYVRTVGITGCESTPTTVKAEIKTCPDHALTFDGANDRLTVQPSTDLNFGTGAFTIESFFKSNVTTAFAGLQQIVSNRNTGSSGFMFGLWTDGHVFLQLGGAPNLGFDKGPKLFDGQCHHVAISRDTLQVVRFYVDGQLTYQTTSTPRNISSSAAWFIGMDKVDNANFFKGIMDEIRVWNINLPQVTLASRSNTKLTGTETGLVANWTFSEGSGETTADIKNNLLATLGTNATAESVDPLWEAKPCASFLRSTEEITIVENGTLEEERTVLIQAAPNPFDGTTKISVYGFEEEVSVQLIDFTGVVRYSKEKHKTSEDIYLGEDISSGTYALIVSDQFRSKQIKIIKLQ